LMRSYLGRSEEMAGSWDAAVFYGIVIVLFVLAAALPFTGVFLAATRHGLWRADLLFRRVVTWSSVGALFFALWELIWVALGAAVEGQVTPLLAPLVSAGVLAVARPTLSRAVDRVVFPRSRELAADMQRIRLAATANEAVMTPDDVASLRASGAAVVTLVSNVRALARRIGHGRPLARTVIRIADADPRFRQFVVFEDDEVWFGFRVPLAGGAQGIVLLDPVRGSRLYDVDERQELHYLFELIQDSLFAVNQKAVWGDEA
jgi:hypothetical protein